MNAATCPCWVPAHRTACHTWLESLVGWDVRSRTAYIIHRAGEVWQKRSPDGKMTFMGVVTNGESMVTVLVTLSDDEDECRCLRTSPLRLVKNGGQGRVDTSTPAFQDLLRLVWGAQVNPRGAQMLTRAQTIWRGHISVMRIVVLWLLSQIGSTASN